MASWQRFYKELKGMKKKNDNGNKIGRDAGTGQFIPVREA